MGAYEDALGWLSSLEVSAGWDLRLERMRAALALRGHPEAHWPAVHVAGTNGKGSTAAMLDAILRAAGYRTGLYTSPHLVDFCERIRVDGRTIPRGTVVEAIGDLRRELGAAGIPLTHFEVATLIAFEWFAARRVDVAVVEVGLGGRLDATNVVHPTVTAITSIALDHVEYLGPDVAMIAGEKAGIAKPGIPLALGRVPTEAERVIAARAHEVGAPLARAGVDGVLDELPDGTLRFRARDMTWDGLRLALPGTFQRSNAAVALLALALAADRLPCAPDAVRRGLATVHWPGRLAVVGRAPLVVLDGAHNAAGIEALMGELPRIVAGRPLDLVFAVMADKDRLAMLAPLLRSVRRAILTRVGRRGASPEDVAAAVGGRVPVEIIDDPRVAVRRAFRQAEPAAAVLVTGSLFLVGEAYAELERSGVIGPLFEPWKGPGASGTGPGA
jgi:dihydrofolate synthase / folylpolyglutamate synthase